VISKNQIKNLKLLQQKKCRDSERLYIIEGFKLVNEAINHYNSNIKQIICTEEGYKKIGNFDISRIEITGSDTIKRISSFKTPQPILAIMHMGDDRMKDKLSNDEIVIALDNIKDPGNLGTIIRLADWFGVGAIYCSEDSVDRFNPKVVQATMGAIFRVKVKYCNLPVFFKLNKGACVYGTMLSGENIYTAGLKLPAILLMGNESGGISEKNQKYINQKIHIPCYSKKNIKTESLNVSTATSIALSELVRKQHYSK
jgi:RNA methyltransferase, TrmH family